MREKLQIELRGISDIERLSARISTGSASPRDLAALGRSLGRLPAIRAIISACESPLLFQAYQDFDLLEELTGLILRTIEDSPPLVMHEGGIIRAGYSAELDELRGLQREGKTWLARFQADETRRTGIKNLKVGFNRVFGYYIEVTNTNRERVPPEYIRKQTLKNAERYITPLLKEHEEKVLHAEERANKMEYELFREVRDAAARETWRLQETAEKLAFFDVLASLAEVALDNNYCRPELDNSDVIEITDGRHPVLDAGVTGEEFVPNDTLLDADENRLIIITGPNMAGKSTYIRQVALLVLLAQMGGFIPAKRARIGIADGIFTRVGASDEIYRGRSTFMVEMTETANILHNATDRSLVILDEVGRGTSTFDGVSLAWAITEHLHDRIGARTLFATHYHELVELAQTLAGVKNYNIAVREWQDEIVFLRKILPGGTDKSYGLQVARLAGIPPAVVDRAKVILAHLERSSLDGEDKPAFAPPPEGSVKRELQMSLFQTPEQRVVEILRKLDIESLTPLEALNKLSELRDQLKQEDP
jgi:DNA mismatch repair protein MutS